MSREASTKIEDTAQGNVSRRVALAAAVIGGIGLLVVDDAEAAGGRVKLRFYKLRKGKSASLLKEVTLPKKVVTKLRQHGDRISFVITAPPTTKGGSRKQTSKRPFPKRQQLKQRLNARKKDLE